MVSKNVNSGRTSLRIVFSIPEDAEVVQEVEVEVIPDRQRITAAVLVLIR